MTEPKTDRGRVTKERILATAASLFHLRGVNATSVEDVLAAAEAGKSQFYRYFASKSDLVSAVIGYQSEHYLGWQREALDGLDSWEAIEAYFDVLVAALAQRELTGGCPIGSLGVELADQDEKLRREVSEVFSRWQESVERGLGRMRAAGKLGPEADPRQLAAATLAGIQGAYLLSIVHKDVRPMKAGLEATLSYLRSFATSDSGRGRSG